MISSHCFYGHNKIGHKIISKEAVSEAQKEKYIKYSSTRRIKELENVAQLVVSLNGSFEVSGHESEVIPVNMVKCASLGRGKAEVTLT